MGTKQQEQHFSPHLISLGRLAVLHFGIFSKGNKRHAMGVADIWRVEHLPRNSRDVFLRRRGSGALGEMAWKPVYSRLGCIRRIEFDKRIPCPLSRLSGCRVADWAGCRNALASLSNLCSGNRLFLGGHVCDLEPWDDLQASHKRRLLGYRYRPACAPSDHWVPHHRTHCCHHADSLATAIRKGEANRRRMMAR